MGEALYRAHLFSLLIASTHLAPLTHLGHTRALAVIPASPGFGSVQKDAWVSKEYAWRYLLPSGRRPEGKKI